MKNQFPLILFCLLAISLTVLTACGKSEAPPPSVPQTILPEPTEEAQTLASQAPATTPVQEEAVTPDYGPNPWTQTYITTDPSIEATPEVLDSITMTLPDDVTRHRVSDRQFDFVKNGTQVGGFLLVDIPEEMLKKAAETKEDFEVLSDHVAKQVMPEIYPEEACLWGGGHIKDSGHYLHISIKTTEKDGLWGQYRHHIYVGEEYCYDFWIDEAWWGDGGRGIVDSLSAADIKPELNKAEFAWSN